MKQHPKLGIALMFVLAIAAIITAVKGNLLLAAVLLVGVALIGSSGCSKTLATAASAAKDIKEEGGQIPSPEAIKQYRTEHPGASIGDTMRALHQKGKQSN